MRWLALTSLISLNLLFVASAVSAPVPQARERGKQLLQKHGCDHCHIVDGRGGAVAPPLDGLGAFRSVRQIEDRLLGKTIKKTAKNAFASSVPPSLMNHVRVSKKDARAIARYLASAQSASYKIRAHNDITGGDAAALPAGAQFSPLPRSADTDEGARLYWQMGCIACHSIGPVGGELGPNLAGIGARRGKNYIRARILKGATILPEPGQSHAEFAMPPQEISEADAEKLVAFLLTLSPEDALYQP